MTTTAPVARAVAALLADFVDALIPGDDDWPPASVVGIQAPLAERLGDIRGDDAVEELARLLLAAGAPFAGRSLDERIAIVGKLERDQPAFFGLVRDAAYLAYCESPAVAARIRELGYAYSLRSHLEGYDLPPFDPARDTPRHDRGAYLRTEAVRRLDLSGLPHLPAPIPTVRSNGG